MDIGANMQSAPLVLVSVALAVVKTQLPRLDEILSEGTHEPLLPAYIPTPTPIVEDDRGWLWGS